MAKEINPKDCDGETPLHVAAEKGYTEICERILKNIHCKGDGCRNPMDNFGLTPLHLAAENGRVGAYQLILKNVEGKNPEDKRGKTPIQLADGHKNILRIFQQLSISK